jgi:3-oxoacyl-[acyl-carrier-protein] synthase III
MQLFHMCCAYCCVQPLSDSSTKKSGHVDGAQPTPAGVLVNAAALFGDGAGAVALGRAKETLGGEKDSDRDAEMAEQS